MNLLIVDDEIATIQIMKRALDWNKLGIRHVYTANNAEEARDIMLTNPIDLIICDIEMPKESGLDLIQWTLDMYPEIITIILTAFPDFNYARSAISLGVFRFLLKPVSFEELEETIRLAIEKIEQERMGSLAVTEVKPEDRNAVKCLKQYLEEHYNETITRKDVESLLHLNRDHINREFKRAEGYTLMEYIQYYRIVMAKKFLRDTDMAIVDISINTGFSSPTYFSKIFKKWSDMTPLEYRAKHKK